MSLRHPLFHRTILALLLDIQESGYEPPTLVNREVFKAELLQELEEGIAPIIDRCCYRNPSVKRSEEKKNEMLKKLKELNFVIEKNIAA